MSFEYNRHFTTTPPSRCSRSVRVTFALGCEPQGTPVTFTIQVQLDGAWT